MRASIGGWLLCAAVSCGSQSSSSAGAPAPEAAVASGGEVEALESRPVAAAATASDDEAPHATGPGTVTLIALVDGKAVPASVRLFDAAGSVRSEGVAGAPITLPAGEYRVEVRVNDPAVMADTPTQTRQLSLQAGQNSQLEAYFRWAKVSLNVLVGGRPSPGARVKLLRDGQVVAELQSGAPPVAITPGRYEADVQLRGSVVRVTGLQFPEGATQTVPVRAQF